MADQEQPQLHTYRGFTMRKVSAATEHLPMQPSWLCGSCGDEWPCGPAREQMLAEGLTRTELAMRMWTYLEDYLMDHNKVIQGSFDRFISWTRPPKP